MMMAIPFLLAFAPPVSGCIAVMDDRIYARDIAGVIPAFAAIPGEVLAGYAPVPGIRRVLSGAFLQRLAKTQGVAIESIPDLCFERPLSPLQPEDIRHAMLTSLEEAGQQDGMVRVEVLNWGQQAAPRGRMVFPIGGIQPRSASDPKYEVVWRGYVLYGDNRRVGIWARARVSVAATRVVALADIPAGQPIHENQVQLESTESFALDTRTARHLDEVVGFIPRNLIRSGALILRSQLNQRPDVGKGDLVKVLATAGAAHLILEGRAQSSGSTGATVWVKNPSSGKLFRGTVASKGTVAIGDSLTSKESIQ